MRALTEMDNETEARRLGDYLYAQGIPNDVDEDEGEWTIWIHDDEQLAAAEAELKHFCTNPSDSKYTKTSGTADRLRKEQDKENEAATKRQVDVRTKVFGATAAMTPHFTIGMIALCVVIFFVQQTKLEHGLQQTLSVNSYKHHEAEKKISWEPGLPDIRKGEVWRLFTPALMHFGFLHIIFNMMWLYQLGGQFERSLGVGRLILFILASAIASNLFQYVSILPDLFGRGPSFGGMSGVVYGLAGHAWVSGRFNPHSSVTLPNEIMTFMMIWFFVCFLPFMGIANGAHTMGLLVGLAWGWIGAQWAMRR